MKYSDIKQNVEAISSDNIRKLLRAERARTPSNLVRKIRIRQSNSDMPEDGTYFDPLYAIDESYRIFKAYASVLSGTYSVQININGSEVGPVMTESTTYPLIFTGLNFPTNQYMKLLVNSSSCEGFEMVLSARVI